MADARTSSNAPSNETITTAADANAYHYAQYYGRAIIKLRTEEANMGVEDSDTYQAFIEEPFDGSFTQRIIERHEVLRDDDDELAVKLLWSV